jgi:hypothetical protein
MKIYCCLRATPFHSVKVILFTIAFLVLCTGCSDPQPSLQQKSSTPPPQHNSEPRQLQIDLPSEYSGRESDVFDIPKEWMNKWKDGLNTEEFQFAQKLSLQGVEQDSKLAIKVREIITNPESFSTDQIDKSFDDLLKLTVNMSLLDWIKGAAAKYQPITLNPTIRTWELLNDHVVKAGSSLDAAITSLAKRAALKPGCELAYMQIKGISPIFWYEYSLAKVEAEKQSCGGLSYVLTKYDISLDRKITGWLDEKWQEQTERVDRLKKYVGNEEFSFLHKELIDGIEGGCEPNIPSLANELGICPWRINTAWTAGITTGLSETMLDDDKCKFKYFPIEMKNGLTQVEIEKAINILAQKLVAGSAASSFAAFKDDGFYPMGYWVNPDQTKMVFQVESGSYSIIEDNSRPRYIPFTLRRTILISVTSKESRHIYVPGGYGQYDDGQIIGITDQDKDGNIEVWISGTWGECDGEDSEPGINCAYTEYYMSEQLGNFLGSFVQELRPQIENKTSAR